MSCYLLKKSIRESILINTYWRRIEQMFFQTLLDPSPPIKLHHTTWAQITFSIMEGAWSQSVMNGC